MKIVTFIFISLGSLYFFGATEIDWSDSYTGVVVIDRPVRTVWTYVSNSSKAVDWSIYFHHITAQVGQFGDGKPGSVRRCFRNENEKGVYWDEKVLLEEIDKKRIILSFNFNGYKIDSLTYSTYVLQEYSAINDQSTQLTFKTKLTENTTILDCILFYFAKHQIEEIFHKNLINIKNNIEGLPKLYPYTNKSYNFFEK